MIWYLNSIRYSKRGVQILLKEIQAEQAFPAPTSLREFRASTIVLKLDLKER